MYSGQLNFKNGKFRIMQIADMQEELNVNPDTVKLVTLAIEKEKPDLIVLSGDQIYGMSPSVRGKNAEKKVRSVLRRLLEPIEKAGIPFAVTYGNHDFQCGIPNKDQAKIYAESDFFAEGETLSDDDRGTERIPIYDGGNHVFDIILFDSNGQTATGEYLPVKESQLNWLRGIIDEDKKAYGKTFPAIVIQHIPVPEYYDVLKKVSPFTHGSVEAFRVHKNEWYVLPDEIKANGGFMLESPAIPDRNSGEFELLNGHGGILGLFVGHDHNNSFVAEKDGIALAYTQGAGFNVYGPKRNRGVRIIDLDSSDLASFSTHTVTFGELTDDKVSKPVREFVLTHIPTSMEQVKRLAVIAGAAGLIMSGTIIYQIKKGDK